MFSATKSQCNGEARMYGTVESGRDGDSRRAFRPGQGVVKYHFYDSLVKAQNSAGCTVKSSPRYFRVQSPAIYMQTVSFYRGKHPPCTAASTYMGECSTRIILLRGTKMCAVGPDSPDRGKSAASQTSSKVFCGVSPPGTVRLPGGN